MILHLLEGLHVQSHTSSRRQQRGTSAQPLSSRRKNSRTKPALTCQAIIETLEVQWPGVAEWEVIKAAFATKGLPDAVGCIIAFITIVPLFTENIANSELSFLAQVRQ